MSSLNENEYRTLVAVAEAGGNMLNQYDSRYQALIAQLLSQNKDVLLLNLLDALRRLKKEGEQVLSERNAHIQRMEMALKQREVDLLQAQSQLQSLHGEVTQFRALAQQHHWQQQAGFNLSPAMQSHQLSPAMSGNGGGYNNVPSLNIADYGRQVLMNSYSMN